MSNIDMAIAAGLAAPDLTCASILAHEVCGLRKELRQTENCRAAAESQLFKERQAARDALELVKLERDEARDAAALERFLRGVGQ